MTLSQRSRYLLPPFVLILITTTLFLLSTTYRPYSGSSTPFSSPVTEEKPQVKSHPLYKPAKPPPPPPLPEYFPLAASAQSPSDLPPVPSWNRPPSPHVPEKTRLYIGFTRYWPLLQQVVVSYITAGWPPEDIYVVENTGTFDANKRGLLTSSNPFYLDYHRLTKIFGVNVMTTPSLQSFAQLQNLYLSEAIHNNLSCYFWGHMDVVAQTHEDAKPYRSLYQIAVDTIRESVAPEYRPNDKAGSQGRWAIRFFSYDWLALVNVAAYVEVGGWDSMISYYGTDCDMHARLAMNGLETPIADAGQVYDVGRSLPDLEVLYRRRRKNGTTTEKSLEERQGQGTTGSTFDEEKTVVTVGADGKVSVGGSTNAAEGATTPTNPNSSSTATDPIPNTSPNHAYLAETEEDTLGGPGWVNLQETLQGLAQAKIDDPYRNSWQLQQKGGAGEPYHYDAEGWEKALQMTIEAGVKIYEEKWGHKGCDIRDVGLKEGDQWRVEHDWE